MTIEQIRRNTENQLAAGLKLRVEQFVKSRKNRLKLAGEIKHFANSLVEQVLFQHPEEAVNPVLTQPMSKDRKDDQRSLSQAYEQKPY